MSKCQYYNDEIPNQSISTDPKETKNKDFKMWGNYKTFDFGETCSQLDVQARLVSCDVNIGRIVHF